jgi:shikimate kinase
VPDKETNTYRTPLTRLPTKPLVLVGMMGAGKTAIGRRVAERLDCPFLDADDEIETAAGCSINDIFAMHGEAAFRNGERRVIKRLLDCNTTVLATGGGAFMDAGIRQAVRDKGISIWLRADIETLWQRVNRRDHRPLLETKNPRETLERLIQDRYPTYAEADITVDSDVGPLCKTVDRVMDAIEEFLKTESEE